MHVARSHALPAGHGLTVFSFLRDTVQTLRGATPSPFMAFFVYAWLLWSAKALVARRYAPSVADAGELRTTVLVPVYREAEPLFRQVLASVLANEPTEVIVVVDGGDPALAAVAEDFADQVLRIAKVGKRGAIAAGFAVSDPGSDVVLVLDSDTVWAPDALAEMLRPFADPRVGGVTPRQAIFDARHH